LDLEEFLAKRLGTKVDLVSKNALKPYIGKRILEEVVMV
jgi:predicted nucleotidyltransferase